MKRVVIVLSALMLLAPAAASAAEDVMIVRYGDLNLSSDAGARAALRRIRHAADRFCGPSDQSLRMYVAVESCKTRMVDKAVTVLAEPRVTAMHTGQEQVRLARK
jgi:UrcA family protein